ncbi:MAG: DUF86 domain-containing protein [Candidatus Rokubacteria bacterium]|nr:DUF86 domain-containing protein [Candidatus Rokubacteria bacterium]
MTLRQMRDSTRRALSLAEGRSRAALDQDWVATLAVMQLLQIIGEAARRLSDDLRQQHPEIPWAQLISLRNRLIHGYDTVDLDRLWELLTVDLPALATALDRILESRG